MKSIITLALAALLSGALTGCGESSQQGSLPTNDEEPWQPDPVIRVTELNGGIDQHWYSDGLNARTGYAYYNVYNEWDEPIDVSFRTLGNFTETKILDPNPNISYTGNHQCTNTLEPHESCDVVVELNMVDTASWIASTLALEVTDYMHYDDWANRQRIYTSETQRTNFYENVVYDPDTDKKLMNVDNRHSENYHLGQPATIEYTVRVEGYVEYFHLDVSFTHNGKGVGTKNSVESPCDKKDIDASKSADGFTLCTIKTNFTPTESGEMQIIYETGWIDHKNRWYEENKRVIPVTVLPY